MDEKIQLGEPDRVFFNLEGLYFFDGKLDEGIVKKSLEHAVGRIPVISSEIRSEGKSDGGRKIYFIQPTSSSNVELFKKTIKNEVYDYFKPNEKDFNKLSLEEGYYLHSLIESIPMKENVLDDAVENTPILKITLLETESSDKSILCLSISHTIADLHSFISIVDCLGNGMSSKILGPFTYSKKHFLARPGFTMENCDLDSNIIAKYPSCFPRELGNDGGGFKMTKSGKILKLYFSKKRIEYLKKMVLSEDKDYDLVLSSFDVITAHLWKLQALKETEDPYRIVPIHIVVNVRKRILEIPETYIGNALLCPGIELSRKEVLDSSMATLCRKLRTLITSITLEDLHAVVDLWSVNVPMYQRINSLFVDDWRLVDQMKPKFISTTSKQEGKECVCERCVLMPPYSEDTLDLNWTFLGLYEDGITVRMVFEKDFLGRFGKSDLTDPLSLAAIRKEMGNDK